MSLQVSPAEDVSNALFKVLPRGDSMVDHYRHQAVWDMAIVEALAIFAETGAPIPRDVVRDVRDFVDRSGINPRFRRAVEGYLARIVEAA
jgi:hypothetical protein